MTVKEVIEKLQKLPDKKMEILLDCPHCGHSQQLSGLDEVVVARGNERNGESL